jgi:hypothetical protein
MRLAIYYDNITGRNDGNPLYVWNALKRMQEASDGKVVEVDHLAPMANVIDYGKYDTHIWVDWGEDALKSLITYPMIDCPRPNIYWASDTHLGYDYRLEMAKKFDHVFVAQKRAVEEFKRDGVEAEWLPHAFEPLAYPKFELASKKYDVGFIGHINSENRIDALDRLFKEFPNFFYGQRLFEEAAEKFCESKIVFNISMLDDLNMRTFEAMGTGSFLLTNWIPTIEEVFEDGKHLVLYRSLDEMVDKAKWYLAHDSERERIALAGYEEVMAKHTIQHRVDRMLEVANKKLLVGV